LIDTEVLVLEAVTQQREEFEMDTTHSTSLVNELCDVKQLLKESVEFYCGMFVTLLVECKQEKNSPTSVSTSVTIIL